MDLDQYDEFGTYIGPELESSDESGSSDREQEVGERGGEGSEGSEGGQDNEHEADTGMEVVLHEDKKYYPTALEVSSLRLATQLTFISNFITQICFYRT